MMKSNSCVDCNDCNGLYCQVHMRFLFNKNVVTPVLPIDICVILRCGLEPLSEIFAFNKL